MTDATNQIASGLGRLAIYWRGAAWQVASAAGINPSQAEILSHLARRGASRQVELAAALGVTAASLSDSVASLVAKGLVVRQTDSQDRRAVQVMLTGEGQKVQAGLPEAPDALVEALGALPEAEAGQMLRAMTRVIRVLQEARAIPVQRVCVTCRHFRPHVHDDATAPHHCAFVDAAFGDAGLRLDCTDHEGATEQDRTRNWAKFDTAA